MKRIAIAFVLVMGFVRFSFAQLSSVEITDDFRKAVKSIAQDEFKEFIYNKIKEANPILAASTYDLIDNIVSGDSLSLIFQSVINTIIDYGTLQLFQDSLRSSLNEVRTRCVYYKNKNPLSDDDYSKIRSLCAIYLFEAEAIAKIQPIGDHVTDLLYSEDGFFKTFHVRSEGGRSGDDSIDVRSLVAALLMRDSNPFDKIYDDAVVLKSLALSIYMNKRIDSVTFTQRFRGIKKNYQSQLDHLRDVTQRYVLAIRSTIVETKPSYSSIIEFCLPYLRNFMIGTDLSSSFSEKLFVRNLAKNIEKNVADMNSALSYEIGLGADYFFQGPSWLPDTSKYPILSLRLNDRVQWSFISYSEWRGFIYVGGFIDALLKDITNNGQNVFLYLGAGMSLGSITTTVSTGYPVGRPGERTWAGMVDITYDLPISKLLKSLAIQ